MRLTKWLGFGQARAVSLGGVALQCAEEYLVTIHLMHLVSFLSAPDMKKIKKNLKAR